MASAEEKPATACRQDLMWGFVSAVVGGRQAVPSALDGLNAQIVADAVLESQAQGRYVQVEHVAPA